MDPADFTPFLPRIKQATDAVVNISTGGSLTLSIQDRIKPAATFSAEMCLMNMGAMNSRPALRTLAGMHLWHAPMSSCSQCVRIVLAETGRDFESHLVDLPAGEHASTDYQAIHPQGLLPALDDDGRLFIESIDIIRRLGGALEAGDADDLQPLADASQADLKLLTFEFLFRGLPRLDGAAAETFQRNHRNAWLTRFHADFAAGFAPERVIAAVARTDAGFWTLEERLADGRTFLGGDSLGLADVAWMPNLNRFALMDWPFGRYRLLALWFDRVAARDSYRTGLLSWQPGPLADKFAACTRQRQAEGTDVRSVPHFRDPKAAG